MRFYSLIRNDIKNGFYTNRVHYAVLAILTAGSCLDMGNRIKIAYHFAETSPETTLGDMILYLFGGMHPYIPELKEAFVFPVRWFLLMMMILYGGLYFAYRDLHTIGANVLTRSASRAKWWYSKCLWIFWQQCTAYLLIYAVLIVFCISTGKEPVFRITPEYVNRIMWAGSEYQQFPIKIIWMTLTLPMLITTALCIWQNVLSLFMKPIFSYITMAVILLSSAYLMSPFLIGNYAMPIRYIYVIEDGINPLYGYAAAIILLTAGVAVGTIRLKKYDIMGIVH